MKQVRLLLLLALPLAATWVTAEWKGDLLEQKVRNMLYRLANDSVPVYNREVAGPGGIPYVEYAELNGVRAGRQYNPTIVCNYALDYLKHIDKKESREAFFNCARWLRAGMTYHDGAAFFVFKWQQPWYDSVKAPFTSGMTSGLAIQVFTGAYRLTGDSGYLRAARDLLRGYFIPVSSGGFTYMSPDGWWYEELADPAGHTPYILDGHIFAVTGVHPYWLQTKDDSAAMVMARGLAALKSRLRQYDRGDGWSYYDRYQKPSDKKYHRLLTSQMKQLYQLTRDPLFLDYHQRWRGPMDQPYVARTIVEGNRSGFVLLTGLYLVFLALTASALRLFRRLTPSDSHTRK